MSKPVNESHKRIIEQAGAVYVPGRFGELVLFNSSETGSTLALPESELTVEAVKRHVQESNVKFDKGAK